MRREPAPANGAGEAKLVEYLGVVIADAPRQYLALPCARGDLKSLELAQDLERAVLIARLRARRNVLPAEKPAHEGGGGYGLNLLAQRAQREPVDTRQQAALAPLHEVVDRSRPRLRKSIFDRRRGRLRSSELAAEDQTRGLNAQ